MHFCAIQRHSGEIFVDPVLQDKKCYWMTSPSTSTTSERLRDALHCAKWTATGRTESVFFTAVNPTDIQPFLGEVEYDLDKPRIAPYKHTWRSHHNAVFWCNLKSAQREGYQTLSHAFTLSDTLPAICIDKVVCMKTREELYCRKYKSTRLPRVTLVPNSHHVRKDAPVSESRNTMTVRMNPWQSTFRW